MSLPPDLLERALDAGDLADLHALAHACDKTYLEWAPAGWTVPHMPPNFGDRYLAEAAWMQGAFEPSGRLVATVAFRPSDDDPDETAHVGLVFVHPTRWREGIASTMLERAEAEMVARGFVRERLWTPRGAPAERFYQARGWRLDGRTDWNPWVGLDMVGYARELL